MISSKWHVPSDTLLRCDGKSERRDFEVKSHGRKGVFVQAIARSTADPLNNRFNMCETYVVVQMSCYWEWVQHFILLQGNIHHTPQFHPNPKNLDLGNNMDMFIQNARNTDNTTFMCSMIISYTCIHNILVFNGSPTIESPHY